MTGTYITMNSTPELLMHTRMIGVFSDINTAKDEAYWNSDAYTRRLNATLYKTLANGSGVFICILTKPGDVCIAESLVKFKSINPKAKAAIMMAGDRTYLHWSESVRNRLYALEDSLDEVYFTTPDALSYDLDAPEQMLALFAQVMVIGPDARHNPRLRNAIANISAIECEFPSKLVLC